MDIITDVEKLAEPAVAYEFITETGVDIAEGEEIIKTLTEALEEHTELISLAAPQIGINKRIFGIRFADTIKVFVNPIVTRKTGQTIFPETCASLPGKEYIIGRPAEVTAVYYTGNFEYEENKFVGPAARIFDQMIQLLDGILPTELGLESDIEEDGSWSEATDEELAEAQTFYKEVYIPKMYQAHKAQIDSNEELAAQYKMYKLSEDVINDRTQVVDSEATQQVINAARAVNKQKRYIKQQSFKAFAGRRRK